MTIILGPVLTGDAARKVKDKATGKVYYRKQILPEGKFKYKGDELDLSPDQLKTYVKSFKDGAFDEVPFQFGGSESEHNNDPLKRGGTLAHMEHVPGKGVMGFFDFSMDPKSVEYVEKYPKFGVSPRIELGIDRADGKKFAGAIQHVCGTLVPRINGMDPWEKIELSSGANTDDSDVIDLSSVSFEDAELVEDIPEIDFVNDKPKEDDVAGLSEADRDLLDQLREENELINSLVEPMGKQMTQELSNGKKNEGDTVTALEDAQARTEIREMKAGFARDKWAAQKALLLSQGVPPASIELADAIMSAPDDKVIELSGGTTVTDKERTLGLLEAQKGFIDLSAEKGHQVSDTVTQDQQKDLDEWRTVLGLGTF